MALAEDRKQLAVPRERACIHPGLGASVAADGRRNADAVEPQLGQAKKEVPVLIGVTKLPAAGLFEHRPAHHRRGRDFRQVCHVPGIEPLGCADGERERAEDLDIAPCEHRLRVPVERIGEELDRVLGELVVGIER